MPMRPAISQLTTLNASFERDIEDYSAAACHTIELWLGKLETYLETPSANDTRELLTRHGVRAPVASLQGGLWTSQGDARREHWSHFQRRLELCRVLAIETLIVAGDLLGPIGQQEIDRTRVSLVEAARMAQTAGVRLAFEFQARATFANNLATAVSLIESCDTAALGLCLDVVEFYLGPSKQEDLELLSPSNLFHVQVADMSCVPREWATDADRILPGDGDFRLPLIIDALNQIGYDGLVSLELMNPQIWRISPRQVAEVGVTALRKLLGQASMD